MKVVALIPAYNGGVYLRASVSSMLEQTRLPNRICVIDDGSTDGSINSIIDFAEKGWVEIVRNPDNIGKAESLNRCFEEISADYFVLQDADDASMPERVERQVAFMEADPCLGCSGSFVEYVSAAGRTVGKGVLDLTSDDKLEQYLKGGDPFGLYCPGVILRGEVVRNRGLRFRKRFWPADDIDLWNRIAEAGWKVRAQPEILVKYRVHGASAVTSGCVKARIQYEWVRACLRERRRGGAEPNREEFLASWQGADLTGKIQRWRRISAKCRYREAGFRLAEGQRGLAYAIMVWAVMLDPRYVYKRLKQQWA